MPAEVVSTTEACYCDSSWHVLPTYYTVKALWVEIGWLRHSLVCSKSFLCMSNWWVSDFIFLRLDGVNFWTFSVSSLACQGLGDVLHCAAITLCYFKRQVRDWVLKLLWAPFWVDLDRILAPDVDRRARVFGFVFNLNRNGVDKGLWLPLSGDCGGTDLLIEDSFLDCGILKSLAA